MERLPNSSDAPNTSERISPPAEKLRLYLAAEQAQLAKQFESMQTEVPAGQRLTLSPDFRIMPPSDFYSEEDKDFVRKKMIKNHGSADEKQIRKDENERAGFLFEMLKTSIMHKKAGDRFIVVRSSRYDDEKNHIDNVFVDRKTGETVCALDEISPKEMNDAEAQKKKDQVRNRNFGYSGESGGFGAARQAYLEPGMSLKYGIELADGKMSCKELRHLPIFMLSLDHDHLNEGMEKFKNDTTSSEYEDLLFSYFLSSLSTDIKKMKLDSRRYPDLPSDMRTRVGSLEAFLKEQGIR